MFFPTSQTAPGLSGRFSNMGSFRELLALAVRPLSDSMYLTITREEFLAEKRPVAILGILILCAALVGARAMGLTGEAPLKIAVSFGQELGREPLDGLLLLLISTDDSYTVRHQETPRQSKSHSQAFRGRAEERC